MKHFMKLQNEPFTNIKRGTKTVEMRLFDEKRKQIKVGDTIEFTNIATSEKLYAKVIALHKFKNFEELYSHFDKTQLGYKQTEIASPNDMNQYYTNEDIEKYGVLGIEIKKYETNLT